MEVTGESPSWICFYIKSNLLGKTHFDREENPDANILFKINERVSKNVGKEDMVS